LQAIELFLLELSVLSRVQLSKCDRNEVLDGDVVEGILSADHLDFLMKVDHRRDRHASSSEAKSSKRKKVTVETNL
jgi:hypothetical protein